MCSLYTNIVFGKTKGGGEGREGKGKGGKREERRGKRKDSFFYFPCLVCKGKLEGNTPYILVGLTISTLSFSSQFGMKEYSEPWRNLFPSFSFSSQHGLVLPHPRPAPPRPAWRGKLSHPIPAPWGPAKPHPTP